MKRTVLLVAAALVLAGCGASSSDTGNSPVTVPSGNSSSSGGEQSSPPATSGDWKFAQVKVKNNSGIYTGTMRATNITGEKRSGLFTVTGFDKGGQTVGTLTGSANDVAANATVTVTLISGDDLKGAVKYEVQVDGSF